MVRSSRAQPRHRNWDWDKKKSKERVLHSAATILSGVTIFGSTMGGAVWGASEGAQDNMRSMPLVGPLLYDPALDVVDNHDPIEIDNAAVERIIARELTYNAEMLVKDLNNIDRTKLPRVQIADETMAAVHKWIDLSVNDANKRLVELKSDKLVPAEFGNQLESSMKAALADVENQVRQAVKEGGNDLVKDGQLEVEQLADVVAVKLQTAIETAFGAATGASMDLNQVIPLDVTKEFIRTALQSAVDKANAAIGAGGDSAVKLVDKQLAAFFDELNASSPRLIDSMVTQVDLLARAALPSEVPDPVRDALHDTVDNAESTLVPALEAEVNRQVQMLPDLLEGMVSSGEINKMVDLIAKPSADRISTTTEKVINDSVVPPMERALAGFIVGGLSGLTLSSLLILSLSAASTVRRRQPDEPSDSAPTTPPPEAEAPAATSPAESVTETETLTDIVAPRATPAFDEKSANDLRQRLWGNLDGGPGVIGSRPIVMVAPMRETAPRSTKPTPPNAAPSQTLPPSKTATAPAASAEVKPQSKSTGRHARAGQTIDDASANSPSAGRHRASGTPVDSAGTTAAPTETENANTSAPGTTRPRSGRRARPTKSQAFVTALRGLTTQVRDWYVRFTK